ncbi:membrane protein [Aeromonas veronii]|uniref:Membrane protein n=1 Tax=Aeromonas veronii TaxID=654 RepID=A0A6S5BU70_AERVE|nr:MULTISPECIES: YbfA family protein [Aeromonas]BBR40667.1 membrane protein [Aeromonas veronii]
MFHPFSMTQIILRRIYVLLVGILAFPVMLFRSDRARFYSYLHRIWNKTSTKPVWLKMSERGERIFY